MTKLAPALACAVLAAAAARPALGARLPSRRAPAPRVTAAALRTPGGDVGAIFSEIERLERSEDDQTADVVRARDRHAEKLAPEVLRWGRRAVAPLLALARDASKTAKTRLLAVSTAGLVRDPGAFLALRAFMLDDGQPDGLRAQAALGLAGLPVSRAARSEAFCAALDRPAAGPELRRQALLQAAELGCRDPDVLERAAKSYGDRPEPAQAELAACAVRGLGAGYGLEPARALWRLYAFFPGGSALRREALLALDRKRAALRALPETEHDALSALSASSGTPDAAVAARLVGAVGTPRCVKALERALRDPDAEVVAQAAESLAQLKDKSAAPALRRILAGAIHDERFAPRPGRADPAKLLARIQAAAEAL